MIVGYEIDFGSHPICKPGNTLYWELRNGILRKEVKRESLVCCLQASKCKYQKQRGGT